MPLSLRVCGFDSLDAATLYALLRLRVDVFVVEQACAYPELDGRDSEPRTWHVWASDADRPVGYLRMLVEADGSYRIGRVCVARENRGDGLAGRLMDEALRLSEGQPVVLEAQSHLRAWYERLGFRDRGPEYVEDGIPHVPMLRSVET